MGRFVRLKCYFTTRWTHSKECWEHARRHGLAALLILIGSAYIAYTEWFSFIALPKWAKPESWPKIPLPWAMVGILLLILFVVIEGSYRLHNRGTLSQPDVLGHLPIYHQHLTIEMLEVCQGIDLDMDNWYLFVRLRVSSTETIGINKITASVTVNGGTHQGCLLRDLKHWFLRRSINETIYPSSHKEDVDLESIWEGLEGAPLQAGQPKHGWLGFVIAQQDLTGGKLINSATNIKLAIEDGLERLQYSTFMPPWPYTESKVINAALPKL